MLVEDVVHKIMVGGETATQHKTGECEDESDINEAEVEVKTVLEDKQGEGRRLRL